MEECIEQRGGLCVFKSLWAVSMGTGLARTAARYFAPVFGLEGPGTVQGEPAQQASLRLKL